MSEVVSTETESLGSSVVFFTLAVDSISPVHVPVYALIYYVSVVCNDPN